MDSLFAFTLIFIVYALGDAVATKTKGVISMMLFAFVFYLIGFWTFLPSTALQDSGFTAISNALVCLLMVHIGTTIKLRDFVEQWKTVVIALIACAGVCFGICLIATLFIDRGYALVGGPILSGAIVAALIMQEAAQAIGREDLVVFASVILVVQNFIGIPIASLCLKSEAKRLKALITCGDLDRTVENGAVQNKSALCIIPPIPAKYLSGNVIIAKLAIVSVISTVIANATDGKLNKLVVCLVLGVLLKEIGFLEESSITKANGSVFVMAAAPIAAFIGLVNATPQMLLGQLAPLAVVVVIGLICLAVSSVVVGKLFHYSWQMSTALGTSALFGFPTTYILANEIACSVGENEAEQNYLRSKLQPHMVIAGIVTVSISSVIFAGIVANWL